MRDVIEWDDAPLFDKMRWHWFTLTNAPRFRARWRSGTCLMWSDLMTFARASNLASAVGGTVVLLDVDKEGRGSDRVVIGPKA